MDDAAVPPPARRRSLRIPGLAAAPWALVAVVIGWLCGYTTRREKVCPRCCAAVVFRESGLYFGWDRIVPLGRSRVATLDTALAGVVNPDCNHREVGLSTVEMSWLRAESPAQRARQWVIRVDDSAPVPALAWGTGLLRTALGRPSQWDYQHGIFGGSGPGRPGPQFVWTWASDFQFKMQSRPALRATVRAAVDAGEVSIDDLRALLDHRPPLAGARPTAEELRLRDIAIRFATSPSAYREVDQER